MSEQKRKRGRPTNRSCARSIFSPEKKLELLRMNFFLDICSFVSKSLLVPSDFFNYFIKRKVVLISIANWQALSSNEFGLIHTR